MRKHLIPRQSHCLCGVFMFFSCLCGLSPGSLFPHTPEQCAHKVKWRVKIVPIWVGVRGEYSQWRKGILSRAGTCLTLSCPGRILLPTSPNWNKQVGKEFLYLFYSSFTFISMLTLECFGSLFRSLVMFLWPEICCRNSTLVYINQPMVKSVLLYVLLFKTTVS